MLMTRVGDIPIDHLMYSYFTTAFSYYLIIGYFFDYLCFFVEPATFVENQDIHNSTFRCRRS